MKRKQTKPTNEFHTHITFVAHQTFWAILFCNIEFFVVFFFWLHSNMNLRCSAASFFLFECTFVCAPNICCMGQLHLRLCLDKKCGKKRQQIKYVLICSFFHIYFIPISFAVFSVLHQTNWEGEKKDHQIHIFVCFPFVFDILLRNSYAIIVFSFRWFLFFACLCPRDSYLLCHAYRFLQYRRLC